MNNLQPNFDISEYTNQKATIINSQTKIIKVTKPNLAEETIDTKRKTAKINDTQLERQKLISTKTNLINIVVNFINKHTNNLNKPVTNFIYINTSLGII